MSSSASKPVKPLCDRGMFGFLQTIIRGDVSLDRLLVQAIDAKDVVAARSAIDAGASINGNGSTDPLLFVAIEREANEVALLLLERGADPNQTSFEDHISPLHIACRQGWIAGIDALIGKGAALDGLNRIGMRPVELAIGTQNFQRTVDHMISRGVDINELNGQGQSLLHLGLRQMTAAQASKAAEWLLARGANPELAEQRTAVRDSAGRLSAPTSLTPLQIVVSRNDRFDSGTLDWFVGAVDAHKAMRFMKQIRLSAQPKVSPG